MKESGTRDVRRERERELEAKALLKAVTSSQFSEQTSAYGV